MKQFFTNHSGKLFTLAVVVFAVFLGFDLYNAPVEGFEQKLVYLLKEQGYVILFAWSMLEGEMGLIMAGLLCHTGDMMVPFAIFVAGIGGFVGDQVYFYIGRYNKAYIHKRLIGQRRKFALAHLLLKKYGWPIIFVQRYMYGMRTVIPISIGLTRYSAKKFALINIISAWCWAALTIVPVWYFGEEILTLVKWAKDHWYLAIPIVIVFVGSIFYYFHSVTKRLEKKIINEKKHVSKEN